MNAQFEMLYRRPLMLPIGMVSPEMVTVVNLPHDKLSVGCVCRDKHFGVLVPDGNHTFKNLLGYEFLREVLFAEPECNGQPIRCWARIS